jgi:hypothetical protein
LDFEFRRARFDRRSRIFSFKIIISKNIPHFLLK